MDVLCCGKSADPGELCELSWSVVMLPLRIAYVIECEPFTCGQTSILYDLLWQNCDFTCRNEGAVQYPICAYVSKSKDMANCDTMSLACYCVDMLIM